LRLAPLGALPWLLFVACREHYLPSINMPCCASLRSAHPLRLLFVACREHYLPSSSLPCCASLRSAPLPLNGMQRLSFCRLASALTPALAKLLSLPHWRSHSGVSHFIVEHLHFQKPLDFFLLSSHNQRIIYQKF
jgi:hypothetical protein